MTETFSIGVVARLKHGDFLRALEERGWNQTQGAEFLGISVTFFCKMINMQWVPVRKLSKKFEMKLLKLTGKLVEDLWPETVFTKDFLDRPKVVKAVFETSIRQLTASSILQLTASPEDILQEKGLEKKIAEVLGKITLREERVLRKRFFDDKGLEEIGKELAITPERVRQIEMRALRKLRHPIHVRKLRPFLKSQGG